MTDAVSQLPPRLVYSNLLEALSEAQKPRSWLFEGAIERSPIVTYTGPEKSSKSWTWIDAAVSCITGEKWLGVFSCLRPGPVIYLDSEYGDQEFARRAARICRGRGLPVHKVFPSLWHLYSHDLELHQGNGPLKKLLSDITLFCPSLIILDPWRNYLGDKDENSAKDVTAALAQVRRLKEATGAVVVLLHHLNKAEGYSGSRALMTGGDLNFVWRGAQKGYEVSGRWVRHSDKIAGGFHVRMEHTADDDQIKATTTLTAKLKAPSKAAEAVVQGGARARVAGLLSSTPQSTRQLRERAKISSGEDMANILSFLQKEGVAKEQAGGWVDGWTKKASTQKPSTHPNKTKEKQTVIPEERGSGIHPTSTHPPTHPPSEKDNRIG